MSRIRFAGLAVALFAAALATTAQSQAQTAADGEKIIPGHLTMVTPAAHGAVTAPFRLEVEGYPDGLPRPGLLVSGNSAQSSALPEGYGHLMVEQGAVISTRSVVGPSCPTNNSTQSATAGFADLSGAISAKAMIVATNNSRIQIYNRTSCALLSGQSLESFFAPTTLTATTVVIYPRIIYDRRSKRFFISATGYDPQSQDKLLLFAVSTDASGTAWAKYKQQVAGSHGFMCSADTSWFGLIAGVQNNRWLVTGQFNTVNGPLSTLMVIDKTPTLSGAGAAVQCFSDINASIAPPVVLDANARATVIGQPFAVTGSALSRFDLDVSGTSPALDTLTQRPSYTVPAFNLPPVLTQPNGQKIGLVATFSSPSIQTGGRLWNVHTVLAGSFARWRLYKLQNTATASSPVNMTFTVPSTTTANNDHLFNPSLATASAALGSPIFVTASRLIPSITTGFQGNAAMLIFEGSNSSNLVTDWMYNVGAVSQFQYSHDGQGNTCNTAPEGSCFFSNWSSTQSEIGAAGLTKAWSWNQTTGGTTQLQWRTRAVRSEYGPF